MIDEAANATAWKRLTDAGFRRDVITVVTRDPAVVVGPRAYCVRTAVRLSTGLEMGQKTQDRIGRVLADLPGYVSGYTTGDTVVAFWHG